MHRYPNPPRTGGARRLLVAVVAALGVVALTASCAGPAKPASKTSLTLAVGQDNNSFDPALLENGHRAQYWLPVYDTLLTMDEDATIQPGLATTWEYNADNTVLTLDLRDDVTFTDGTPFNAEAVRANVENLKNGTGQNSVMVSTVAEVVPVDEFTAELHLTEPNPALLAYLTFVGGAMGSPAALDDPAIATTPVGSGPYVLDTANTTQGTAYTYKRNPDYWNAKAYPYDTIKLMPMAEVTARINALKAGQVDGATGSPASVAEAKAAGLTVSQQPLDREGLLLVDRAGQVTPALGEVRVRQAINHAIDTEGILKSIQQGFGTATDQVFNTTSIAHVDALDDVYDYDPAKAKKLLAEAGYPDGFDLLLPENATVAANPIVEQQLGEVGIRVTWDKVPNDSWVTGIQSGKYSAFWMRLTAGDPWWDVQKSVIPAGVWNVFDNQDPELDALIADAKTATDPDDYAAALQKVNTWLTEQAWFAPWFIADAVYFSAKDVKVTMHPQNVVPYLWGYQPTK